MKTIARLALLSSLLLAGAARAQSSTWASTGDYHPNGTLWVLNWEAAKPIADFDKYISNTSFRGFSFEGRSWIRKNLTVGMSASWNRYSQTFDLVTVPFTGGTVSGPVYRYADMFALRGLVHLYMSEGNLRPYAGAGIGGAWAYAYQQSADLTTSQSNFNFIISPEVGFMYAVASGGTTVGLNAALRYTFTTATVGQYHDAQTASLILGLTWGY